MKKVMADITQTGPQTYRQLQKENDEATAKRVAEAYINSGRKPYTIPQNIGAVNYIHEGYTKSPLQIQSEAQGKNDYWGHSMWDADDLTYDEWADPSKMTDRRAENQPWYAQLGAGIAKGVLTAGTTFLDGTLGLMYGVTDALTNNDATRLFDNELSNALMNLNRQAEEWLPNYRTTEEEEDPWYKHLNMNFWADSFIKNLGFTVGAFYSGGVWTKALKALGWLQSGMTAQIIGSVMSGLNEGRVEANNLVYDTMQLRSQQINDAYNTRRNEILAKYSDDDGNLFDAQSAQEEINTLDKQRDGMLQQAQNDADRAGLGDMIANTIFLSMDNMFTLGRLYARGFQTARRATGRAGLSGWGQVKAAWKSADELMGNELAENVEKDAGKYVWNNITKKQAALNSAKIGLLEGNEELMQEFFAQTAGEYYSPDSPDAYYQAMIDGKSNVETQDFFTAVSKGLAQSYGDGSQWEQFAIGALTGLLGMPTFGRVNNADSNTYIGRGRWFGLSGGLGGEFAHSADVNRRGREAVDVMNNFKETVDRNKARFAQSDFFTGIANGAAAAGDQFTFESARDNDMAAAFASFMNTGRESDFRDLVNQDFEHMSNDELLTIARNMNNAAQQWTSEDGNWLPDVDPKAMRRKLIENRNETLKQLDEYKKALLEVRAISNNSLSQSEEDEKTWERWKLSQFGNRGNSIVLNHQDEIQKTLDANKTTLNNIANFLQQHFPNEDDAKFSRIGDFLIKVGRKVKNARISHQEEASYKKAHGKYTEEEADENGLIRRTYKDGYVIFKDALTGYLHDTGYNDALEAAERERRAIEEENTSQEEQVAENTQQQTRENIQTQQSEREIPQNLKDARFGIAREGDGSFDIVFDPTSNLTYQGLMNFASNLNYLNSLLNLLATNKDRDGMISAFLTSTMTSPDLIAALEYFGSSDFEEKMGYMIPNFQDFKKLISDLTDVARLGDAYRKLNNDYNEWVKNPISIRKNRDRLDKKEQTKQANETRRRSKENIDSTSEIDLLRKAIFNGDTSDIDRALSDENKDQASKDKAKRVKNALNYYRQTIAGVRKRTDNQDIINGAISALRKQLQVSNSLEEFMSTNTETIQNASYVSEDQINGLTSAQAEIDAAIARGEDPNDAAVRYEALLASIERQNANGREILENASIDAINNQQDLDNTADKIDDAKEKKDNETQETQGADPTVKPTPSGIVDKDNAEQAAKGKGTEPIDEDEASIPEGVEKIETPKLSDGDIKTLQRQSAYPDDMPEDRVSDKKYNFWKSNTTEFGRELINKATRLYLMTNKPYYEIATEKHKNYSLYKACFEYLRDSGAFDRVKKGKFDKDTEIRFGISKELTDKAGRPVILLLANYPQKGADGKTKDNWLPIGDLITNADYIFGNYNWLDDFYKVATDKYNEQKDKTDNDLVILDGLSTHINNVYIGQPRYVSERRAVNEIFGGEGFKIGIKIGNKIYSGVGKEETFDYYSGKDGQPYVFISTPDKLRPQAKVPVIMDKFHGTRDNPLAEIICDMFDKLSKFTPAYLGTEAGKNEIKEWQKDITKLLARKCAIRIIKDKDTGENRIIVKFSTGETYVDKNGKTHNRFAQLYGGHPANLTPKVVEKFFKDNSVPYQVSLSYINKDYEYNGRKVSYNQLIGAVMKTNLPVGETTTVNNFFTVNPIVDGKEQVGDVIPSKQTQTQAKVKAKQPQDTTGVTSSNGKHQFNLPDGKHIYMDKTTFDITDENGKLYNVSSEQAAYMYGLTVGLFVASSITDDTHYDTPYSDKPFWPSKMKFEDAKINIKDAAETPISDIKFTKTTAVGNQKMYSVAPKTIITLPDNGKVMLNVVTVANNGTVYVEFYTTDKDGNLIKYNLVYTNERGGIPRVILDILNNNNVNVSKFNVLQDTVTQEAQQEQEQQQQQKPVQEPDFDAFDALGGVSIPQGSNTQTQTQTTKSFGIIQSVPFNLKRAESNHANLPQSSKINVTNITSETDRMQGKIVTFYLSDENGNPYIRIPILNEEISEKLFKHAGVWSTVAYDRVSELRVDKVDTTEANPTNVGLNITVVEKNGSEFNITTEIPASDLGEYFVNEIAKRTHREEIKPIVSKEGHITSIKENKNGTFTVKLLGDGSYAEGIYAPIDKGLVKVIGSTKARGFEKAIRYISINEICFSNENSLEDMLACGAVKFEVFYNDNDRVSDTISLYALRNAGVDIFKIGALSQIDFKTELGKFIDSCRKVKDAAEKNDTPDLTDDSTKSTSQLVSDYLNQNSNIRRSYGWIFNIIKDDDFLRELVDACNMYGKDWVNDTLNNIGSKLRENDDASDEDLVKIAKNAFDDSKWLSINQALESEGLWDEKKELRMLTKMLPQLSREGRVAIVNGLIRASSREGDYAWGRFKNGIITISNHAVVGTPYHEAFHYVMDMLLTDMEIESVFKAAREKFGNRCVAELEELLCEDFRKYMNRETDSNISKVKRFWRRIKHVVNSLFGNTSILDNMYYDIMSGRYGKRQERTKVKYESFEDKLSKLNSEIDCILAIAPRNSDKFLAPDGSVSALYKTAYALSKTSKFYEWNKNASRITGYSFVSSRDGDPVVLYLAPNKWNEFTPYPTTKYDKPYFVNGDFYFDGDMDHVVMSGAFDTFPIDIEKVAGMGSNKPNSTGNTEKFMRVSDIRDYHEWKTDYDNLNDEQKEFVDRMARHEWQALDADTRDLALYCIM